MSVVRKLFLDLPVAKKLVVILWLFLLIVVSLLGLSYLTIENLSAARAYVGGEGLWSKAQKQAVHDLLRYSISHSDADYQNYRQALLVPLGDRQARLELREACSRHEYCSQWFHPGPQQSTRRGRNGDVVPTLSSFQIHV